MRARTQNVRHFQVLHLYNAGHTCLYMRSSTFSGWSSDRSVERQNESPFVILRGSHLFSVKKLFGFRSGPVGPLQGVTDWSALLRKDCVCSLLSVRRIYDVYFEKIRVFKAGYCLNT